MKEGTLSEPPVIMGKVEDHGGGVQVAKIKYDRPEPAICFI